VMVNLSVWIALAERQYRNQNADKSQNAS